MTFLFGTNRYCNIANMTSVSTLMEPTACVYRACTTMCWYFSMAWKSGHSWLWSVASIHTHLKTILRLPG